jgi:peptidoglycan L-alanyl-D-glutamate endopeptidase CwlK
MTYKLSERSLDRLEGVNPILVAVVQRAIEITSVDFGVTEGLRSFERQRQYVAAGKSQTMASKHLTGDAVDLVAYIDGSVSWELNLYDDIADSMQAAALELGVEIKWGAAWNVPNICAWQGTMNEAMCHYIDERRGQGRKPFVDGPHFELS